MTEMVFKLEVKHSSWKSIRLNTNIIFKVQYITSKQLTGRKLSNTGFNVLKREKRDKVKNDDAKYEAQSQLADISRNICSKYKWIKLIH